MTSAMKAVAIVPTFNESENLARLLAALLALPVNLDVVVVDDNSPDGTGELADAWSKKTGRVHVIHRPAKLGLGTAYLAGFAHALSHGYERIITMDADFSHDPSYIPAMLMRCERADVVIGSRYVRDGGTKDCTLPRKMLSRTANAVAQTALGLTPRDCTAGFRCYRADVLRSLPLDSIVSNGYSFLVEIAYLIQQRGWRFEELPIVFTNRTLGNSKISRMEIVKAIMTIWRLWCGRTPADASAAKN